MLEPASRSQGTARWSLRLLGGFELVSHSDGERLALAGKRDRLLVSYLALCPHGRASRRKLTSLLWQDTADEAALHNLRNCLSAVRKALGDTEHRILSSQGEDIVLDLSAFDADALTFRRLALHAGHAELDAAAALCSGDLLDGIDIESEEFQAWKRTEFARHRDQVVDVLTRLMAQFEEAGAIERAIETGTRILGFEPLHEGAARRVMLLYGRSGRRGAAIEVYQTLASVLRDEVGVEPEPETRALFADFSRRAEGDIAPPPTKPQRHAISRREKATGPLRSGHVVTSVALPSSAKRYWPLSIVGVALASVALAILLGPQLLGSSNVPGVTQVTNDDTANSFSRDAVTIAVLPFANLSGDVSQEFFSDGITEEINTALARVAGLSVVARTSAFALKNQGKDARTMGQVLRATHLIEGSVRKAGQRVRITTQLVRANDGIQVWSQSYERDLIDIFSLQEEIARDITSALRVPLELGPGESLINNRRIDPNSYEDYLRGKALWTARGVPAGMQDRNITEAASLLEVVVAKNPVYAPAWAFLGGTYYSLASNSTGMGDIADARAVANEFRIKGEAAARRSVQLDPNLGPAYGALAIFAWSRARLLEADELYEKALALDPLEPHSVGAYAIRLASAGRLKKALELAEIALRVDPLYPNLAADTALDRWLNGQNESAIALAKTLRPIDRGMLLALIYASMRRYDDAADALLELANGDAQSDVAHAARLLRMAGATRFPEEQLPRLPPALSMLYLYLGAPERTLEPYERIVDIGFLFGNRGVVWHADYAPVRKTERFKVLVTRAGLVEYWRVKGWPEHCHPTTTDDFECS